MGKKKDAAPAPPAAPFNNPFAALQQKRDELPSKPLPEPQPSAAKSEQKGPARAVVRYERKGHGGKEVTLVEQLELNDKELESWLKAFKGALGCGGRIEDRAIVLQGDQRERLPKLLTDGGVRKVSVG